MTDRTTERSYGGVNVPDRLARVEESYEQLHGDVRRISDAVDRLAVETRSAITGLADRMSMIGRPQWATMLQLGGFLVTIGGLALLPVWLRVGETDLAQRTISKEFLDHIRDGHPSRVQALVEANTGRIEQLDTAIQREMRLINNVTDGKIQQLVEIQHQAAQLHEQRKIELALTAEKLEERMRAIERAVFNPRNP